MRINLVIYLLPILLIFLVHGSNVSGNGTISDTRVPKASKRIVRLYSGTRPKPFVCAGEGFQPDSTDCSIFHRCLKTGNGRYISFKFQCSPGTIYEPETETCNHPERSKRTDCGGNKPIHVPNVEFALNNDISKEIPSPISTIDPLSIQTTNIFASLHTTLKAEVSTSAPFSWASISQQKSETSSSTLHPWASSPKTQNKKTTKTPVIKFNELISNSITPSWMSTRIARSTIPRAVNRQTTSESNDICTSDGFTGDTENCRKFYRCINNQRGGFIRYEFMCAEPTIWDEDKKACNHAWEVKRRRCGRGSVIDDTDASTTFKKNNEKISLASAESIQSQLQVNYGSKVTQTQTQISNGPVKQNQTQINYGQDNSNNSSRNPEISQNQTQISHGAAISQTQTQLNYGDKAVQTQLQIDHSKESSQMQSQISESTTTSRSTTHRESQSGSNSNSNNKCTESGFMGDSEDCKKFYRCVDNGRGGFVRYEFSCGEGTVWDPKLEACNHAWAVKECGGKSPSDSTTQSTIKTTASSTKQTESSSLSTSTSTVSQGYYSSTEETIDEDNDIPYGNQPTSSSTSKPLQQETTITTTKAPQSSNKNDCKSSGFMGDNTDCKKFYRCVDNGNGGYTRYEFFCGEGTVWDQKIEACNHAWAVENCGGTTNSWSSSSAQTTTVRTTSNAPLQNDDYDTGYGSQHDEPNSSSTLASTTTVKSSTVTSQSTQSSNQPSSSSENDCTSSGFMGDNNDCKKFYRCVDNGNGGYTRYEFSCGEGTVWDPKIQACNHAWAVEKCGGNTAEDINKVETTTRKDITTSSTSSQYPDDVDDSGYGQQNNEPQGTHQTTSTRPQNLDNDSNDCKSSGFKGDNHDCKKFYRCVDNGDGTYTRYEFSCGEGTVWDPKIEACNHAWAVEKCGGTSPQSTIKPDQANSEEDEYISGYPVQNDQNESQSTTSASSIHVTTTTSAASNTDNICKTSGFMGDNRDCKRFYRCVDDGKGGFVKYEFTCGEGTVWDQSIEACNHDWAVKGQCSQPGNINSSDGQSSTQTSNVDSETEPHDEANNQPTTSIPISSGSTTKKPSGNNCEEEGFFGDENNCKNFYRCVDNAQGGFIKYEFTCGEGTVWNQDIQACDHETKEKKCSSQTSGSTSTKPNTENDEMPTESTTKGSSTSILNSENYSTSQKPQNSKDDCQSEGFYGDSSNCKKFYRCVDDGKGGFIKYDFTCGDGTVWDQQILACNHETSDKKCTLHNESSSTTVSYSETESSSQEQQTTRQPQETNSDTKDQCETEGFFANSNDCKKFYRCVSNGNGGFTKYDFSCGEGTVWVQEIQACDYDNDVSSCSNKNNTNKPEASPGHQSTTTMSTSTSQHTTQSHEPDKVDDEYSDSSSSKPPEDNEVCHSEGFFGNKNDCTRFYRCVDNGQGGYTKYEFNCGEGTAWDSNIQTCNHISEVESCRKTNDTENQSKPSNDEELSQPPNSSTTKGSTSTESSKPAKTDQCEEAGFFGNTEDCTKFYRCVDDGKGGFTKYDFTCGEGTIWDQDLTTCNHPQDVENPSCSDKNSQSTSGTGSSTTESSETTSSSTTQSSQSTTENNNQGSSNCSQESSTKKPANQKVKCDKAGFYPDPDDCKKFYRCVDWDGDGKRFSVYHFECGEGTIWDPQLETCNHEESVYPPRDCNGTQSQNVSQETTTTEKSTTSEENTTTEGSTTTQSSTEESFSTQQSTSSEQTTEESSTEKTSTTTTQKTTSEQTTKQSTTEKSTTQQTTSESTTDSTTTTQEQTTEESSTTQQSTTSEQTTTETTTTQQSTTTEKIIQQSTTSKKTTTQQSTTSEETTTQQSTTSEQSTQQTSSTDDTTSTTESTTTTEQTKTTTEQSSEQNSTESTDQQSSTTESSTTSTTDSSESTTSESDQSTTSPAEKECPETEDDQYLYVCPTSFRRHPKYCNMFYQCTEDDESHEVKIATFKCPNNTIYDESQTQCVEEDKADKKCNGQMARKHRVKRLNANYKEPIEASQQKHICNSVGYYPFEKNNECSGGFLKCQKSKSGNLRGYVHRCPDGYTYWSISKRCERKETMKDCKQSANIWKDRWEIPVEKYNIAK